MMMKRLIVVLIIAFLPLAAADSQLIINVYIDESGEAFIMGYASNISVLQELDFLGDDYMLEGNEFYAYTQELSSKSGGEWNIHMPVRENLSEFQTTLYLPEGASLIYLNHSEAIGYSIKTYNDSISIEFIAFDIRDADIAVSYRIPSSELTVGEESTEESWDYMPYPILAVMALVGIVLIFIFFIRKKLKSSSRLSIAYKENPLQITPEMEKVMGTLPERERRIIQALIDSGGKLTQAKIRYITDTPKSSLTGLLTNLEHRRIVKKTRMGRTNFIELTEWFISQKEVNRTF